MLPVTFQFIIAMVAYSLNERMARQLDYLREEVRILKEGLALASGKKRTEFTADQRRRLAIKGKALTPEEREACCQLVVSGSSKRAEFRTNRVGRLDWFWSRSAGIVGALMLPLPVQFIVAMVAYAINERDGAPARLPA